MKIKEICLRAVEVAMLDGLIFLMKGFVVNFEEHVFACALAAWLIVACFDIAYATVTGQKKDGDKSC